MEYIKHKVKISHEYTLHIPKEDLMEDGLEVTKRNLIDGLDEDLREGSYSADDFNLTIEEE